MTTTPHPAALAPEDLARLTGYSRQADIERWCENNGVRFFRGRAGVWTTLDAVNAALGLRGAPAFGPTKLEF